MRLDEVEEVKIISYGWTRDSKVEEYINSLLKQGWRLLHIGEEGNEEEEVGVDKCITYTLGGRSKGRREETYSAT